jgi:hypothetical protein
MLTPLIGISNLAKGRAADCGCFGPRTKLRSGWLIVPRNLGFLFLAATATADGLWQLKFSPAIFVSGLSLVVFALFPPQVRQRRMRVAEQ